MEYPDKLTIAAMKLWCKAHRGSVLRIAALVRQRDGKVGVHYSAVHRTLAGQETNSGVVAAFLAHAGRNWAKQKLTPKTVQQG